MVVTTDENDDEKMIKQIFDDSPLRYCDEFRDTNFFAINYIEFQFMSLHM